jgi:hypothetical protein
MNKNLPPLTRRFLALLLLPSISLWGASMHSADQPGGGSATNSPDKSPSEREQNGLRGPVKSSIEEARYPAWTSSDGTLIPENRSTQKAEYDEQGRTLKTIYHNPDGSQWVRKYSYDSTGKLLKISQGVEGQPAVEAVYSYDEQGRLRAIADSAHPGSSASFRYDQSGRKTKVQVARAEDYVPNVGVAGDPFERANAPNLPGGGSVVTVYDEHDRPVEVQTMDREGELMSRAVRTYDERGNIVEEKEILEKAETLIPADARAQILETSGVTGEQLRAEIMKLMGGQSSPYATSHLYDAQGREVQKVQRMFHDVEATESLYNEHGDKSAEITRGSKLGGDEDEKAQPAYSEVRFSYQYDARGNWTEKVTTRCSAPCSGPNGAFEAQSATRRTLTFF